MKSVSEPLREGFASRLQLAINEAGYASYQLKQLAVLFEVTSPAVRKWLTGESFPTPLRSAKLAVILGVRRAWLLDGEQPMRMNMANIADHPKSYSTDVDAVSISAEEFRLLSNYRRLPRNLQKDLAKLMQDIDSRNK